MQYIFFTSRRNDAAKWRGGTEEGKRKRKRKNWDDELLSLSSSSSLCLFSVTSASREEAELAKEYFKMHLTSLPVYLSFLSATAFLSFLDKYRMTAA